MNPATADTLTGRSDLDLAQRAARGDVSAFEAIMRQYNRVLFRTARSILRSDSEAEDALQDAYLEAYRALGRFRGDAQLSTWLTRIVINQALQRMRKRRREGEVFELDKVVDIERDLESAPSPAGAATGPESELMRAQLRRLLEAKIDQLPPAFRTVFVLRALEELSVEDTAASLGIPAATVRSRFFRARSLLREAMEQTVDLALQDAFAFDGARCDRIVSAVLHRLSHSHRGTGPPD